MESLAKIKGSRVRRCNGSFYCFNSGLNGEVLKSLKNGQSYVGENFNCSANELTSLEFCPKVIGGYFDCSNNKITSLEFLPEKVGNKISGYFDLSNNKIKSLLHCPKKINGRFNVSSNCLTSLMHCPEKIQGGFVFSQNNIKELMHKDFPSIIEGAIYCESNNKLIDIYHKKMGIDVIDLLLQEKEDKELYDLLGNSGNHIHHVKKI